MHKKTSTRLCIGLFLALVLPLLLARCQPVPRPFSTEHKGDFTAVQLGPRAGMVVEPVTGDFGAEDGHRLAAAVADALRRHEITAGTGKGHQRSYRLSGQLQSDGAGQLQLHWRLRSAEGMETLELVQPLPISARAWPAADDGVLQQVADAAAAAIDQRLRAGERRLGRRLALAPVTLGSVDGVPGQGRGQLAAAMKLALAEAGVPLTRDPGEDGYILLGSMYVDGAGVTASGRRIEIVWHLIRPDGSELGKVSQANRVPDAMLAGDWRELAQAIARAGAPGVVQLLRNGPGS